MLCKPPCSAKPVAMTVPSRGRRRDPDPRRDRRILLLDGPPPDLHLRDGRALGERVRQFRTSQMLADWYSFSHIVHGLLFYAGLWLLFRWPVERRFLVALVDRGRVGDDREHADGHRPLPRRDGGARLHRRHVINSLSDIAMMALGFLPRASFRSGGRSRPARRSNSCRCSSFATI